VVPTRLRLRDRLPGDHRRLLPSRALEAPGRAAADGGEDDRHRGGRLHRSHPGRFGPGAGAHLPGSGGGPPGLEQRHGGAPHRPAAAPGRRCDQAVAAGGGRLADPHPRRPAQSRPGPEELGRRVPRRGPDGRGTCGAGRDHQRRLRRAPGVQAGGAHQGGPDALPCQPAGAGGRPGLAGARAGAHPLRPRPRGARRE
jgi:hypothetical protein